MTGSKLTRAMWCISFAAAALLTVQPSRAETVQLAYTSADAIYGAWFYAQDKGYFKKNGLDTNLSFIDSGSKGVQTLIGGGADIVAADGNALVSAALSGAPVRYISATISKLTGSAYVAKDIKDPKDLKGKKWGISSFGSEAHIAALLSLKHFGLTDQDVTILQLGNQGNRLAALDAGQISASTFLPPVSSKVESLGYRKIVDMPDLAPDYMSIGAAAQIKTLQTRKPMVISYLKAMAEATAAYKKDEKGGVEVIVKYLKADPKDAEVAWKYYAPLTSGDLKITDASIQFLLDNNSDAKAKTMKPKDFVDASFVQQLDKDGFFKNLK